MPVWLEDLKANIVKKVMARNPNRASLSIKNDSAVNVYYGHSSGVATTGRRQGILVDPNGGALEDRWHKGDVYLIAPSDCNVTLIEDLKVEIAPKPGVE